MTEARTRNFHPNALRQTIKRGLEAVVPSSLLLTQGDATRAEVYLTFDDGPHPDNTPRVLDALRDLSAKGTFFVVGKSAAQHPELVRRIVREGHTLGHHSYYHRKPGTTSALALMREVSATRHLLSSVAGRDAAPSLFRPPLGALTTAKTLSLWAARQRIALWNVDPRDYSATSTSEITSWFDENPLQAGDVVLMHDIAPYTADALPHVVALGRARGLSFAAIA